MKQKLFAFLQALMLGILVAAMAFALLVGAIAMVSVIEHVAREVSPYATPTLQPTHNLRNIA